MQSTMPAVSRLHAGRPGRSSSPRRSRRAASVQLLRLSIGGSSTLREGVPYDLCPQAVIRIHGGPSGSVPSVIRHTGAHLDRAVAECVSLSILERVDTRRGADRERVAGDRCRRRSRATAASSISSTTRPQPAASAHATSPSQTSGGRVDTPRP
jgi:hypothetical protein